MDLETILRVLAPRGYNVNEDTILRHVRLAPYREGCGPTFEFVTWDTNKRARTGQYEIGFALFVGEDENPIMHTEGCGVSPMDAIDSDAAVRGALHWATLKPGDTDAEFFADYTEEQLTFLGAHADALGTYAYEPESEDEDPVEWEDLLEH